jgi:WhiB family redox-sensing transcriptional regulator
VTITTSRNAAGPGEAPGAGAGLGRVASAEVPGARAGLDHVGPEEAPDGREAFDRASWRESAACRDAETELFFPVSSVGPAVAETSRAKAICADCPVRQACLSYALATNQVYGIWGGYDEDERRVLRRRQRRAALAARAAAAVPAVPDVPEARAAKG